MDEQIEKLINLIAPEFNRELLVFSEPMITGKRLRKRWPGLSVRELIQGVDDANDKSNPSVVNNPYNMSDFPLSYMLIGTLFDDDFKKYHLCLSCESDIAQGKPYTRPYKMKMEGKKRKYKLKRIIFRKADIIAYETSDNEWLSDTQHEALDLHNSVEKVECHVDPSWWAGKTPESIASALLDKGIAKEVIAYILAEKLNVSLTKVGQLLSVEEKKKAKELDIKTYQRRAKRMLQKVRAIYNIIIDS